MNSSRIRVVALVLFALAGLSLLSASAGESPLTGESRGGGGLARSAPAWTMPTEERGLLDMAVERAIAAGLPDAKGGTLLYGVVKHPDGQRPKRKQQSPGLPESLHLRLADGRFLLDMRHVVPTSGIGAVDISGLIEVSPNQLLALGATHLNHSAEGDSKVEIQSKRFFSAEEIPKIMFAYQEGSKLMVLVNGGTDFVIPSVHLLRMGVPGAESLAVGLSIGLTMDMRIRGHFLEGKPRPLTLIEDYDAVASFSTEILGKSMGAPLVPTPNALRLKVAEYFLQHFVLNQTENPPLPVDDDPRRSVNPITAALSMFDENDPGIVQIRTDIRRLYEQSLISSDVSIDADLPAILTWWDDETNIPDMGAIKIPVKIHDPEPEDVTRWRNNFKAAGRLRTTEIRSLINHITDERTSRWMRDGHVHTVGDNALRALALRLGVDPRLLIGRDLSAPWTADESAATAAALTTWWNKNQGKPLSELLSGVLGVMTLPNLASVVINSENSDRNQILVRIAKLWAQHPPHISDPMALAHIMSAARNSNLLDDVIKSLPVRDMQRTLLVAWHLSHGNDAPLEILLNDLKQAFLETAVTAPGSNNTAGDDLTPPSSHSHIFEKFEDDILTKILRIVAANPTPARLNRVLALASTMLDCGEASLLLESSTNMNDGYGDELTIWWGEENSAEGLDKKFNDKQSQASVIPWILNSLLLQEQGPAPINLTKQMANDLQHEEELQNIPFKPFAKDLRIADIAAANCWRLLLFWDPKLREQIMADAHFLFTTRIDLSADKVTRDRVIMQQQTYVQAIQQHILNKMGLLLPRGSL